MAGEGFAKALKSDPHPPEKWTTRDAYLANIPEKDKDFVYCDHCRTTLVIRPFLYNDELYLECQVCKFTYKNNGVFKGVPREVESIIIS